MWKNFDRVAYTRDAFAAHVAAINWTPAVWMPSGITLHNTSAPTLKQWAESGPAHDQRILNLQSYYEGMGWHSGPHLFISRNYINGFADILRPGVHSTCFNATHIGIEMVGDYDNEDFDSGDGALVRDNAVFAIATLYRKLGLNPAHLVFHRDCAKDNHACPGSKVRKPDVFARVQAAIGGGVILPPPVAHPASTGSLAPGVAPLSPAQAVQTALKAAGFDPGPIDGDLGPKTFDAVRAFQKARGLRFIDGIIGPETRAALGV